MNNRFLTVIAISVSCAGAVALAGLRFNTIQNLLEGPKTDKVEPATLDGGTLGASSPSVTITEADGMTAPQLIEWMRKQGYKFVLESTDLPKGTRYEVNLKGAKPDDAIQAIAQALNLGWTKKGEVYVLKQGFGIDFGSWNDGGAVLEPMPPMVDGKPSPDWEKRMEEWSQRRRDFQFNGEKLTKEQRAELEKAMQELRKELGNLDGMLPKFVDGFMLMPDGSKVKMPTFSDQDLAELKKLKEFKFVMPEMPEMPDLKDLEKFKAFSMKTDAIKALIDSLTDSQKKLMKDRGYLKPSDLTEKQRNLVGGLDSDGDLSVTFSIDGKTITIKSGDKAETGVKV